MLASSLVKFGFRIRTRKGLIVDHLTIQGRDEADAVRKLRQMYTHCEVLDCKRAIRPTRTEQLNFADVVSLISK